MGGLYKMDCGLWKVHHLAGGVVGVRVI
jgi:hypothetical protein